MATAQRKDQSFASLPAVAKLFILVVILGVVSAVYYFAMHMSLADDIENAKQTHRKLVKERKEAKERQQEYLRLSQELAGREALDRRNRRVLPEKAEIASFLQDLNRLAELSGLSIRLVEPRPEESENLYVRIPVSLRLAGRYHQIMKFFYNVSQLERAINMENVTIGNPHEESEDVEGVALDVNVQATTFRRRTGSAASDQKGGGEDGNDGKDEGGDR